MFRRLLRLLVGIHFLESIVLRTLAASISDSPFFVSIEQFPKGQLDS